MASYFIFPQIMKQIPDILVLLRTCLIKQKQIPVERSVGKHQLSSTLSARSTGRFGSINWVDPYLW
jgi:hypothetical protein